MSMGKYVCCRGILAQIMTEFGGVCETRCVFPSPFFQMMLLACGYEVMCVSRQLEFQLRGELTQLGRPQVSSYVCPEADEVVKLGPSHDHVV